MKAKHLLILLTFFLNRTFAQEYDGFKGSTAFVPYDNTYISPDRKGKHAVSVGLTLGNTHPMQDFVPFFGGHLGYNYILYTQRKRAFGIKEVTRDEPKMGFGVHLTVLQNSEFYLTANYLNPLFALRGKLLGFYFFGEYGVGMHKAMPFLEDPGGIRFNLSLEIFRIRFGKSPMYITMTGHYDAGNKLLSQKRMNLSALLSLRYYIQKK